MSARMSVRPASKTARNPSPRSSFARAMTASMYRSLSPPSGSSVGRPATHDRGRAAQRIAVRRAQPLGHGAHVVAAIAVRRERERLAAEFEVAQPHARREDVHLAAGVVHVVLAVHAPAVGLEQVRDRRAEGGVPAVADVQRPGRVRGDELDDRAPAAAVVAAPVACALREHARSSRPARRRAS